MLRDDSDASSARASGLAGCCAATDAGVPVGCSRTVIIDHGRVIASGTLAELVDRTVGRHRVVMLRLDAPSATVPRGATPAADDPRLLRARVDDVARDLPALLGAVAAQGRVVEDVEVRSPSLQSVFIHLTGRELRE